MEEPQVILVDEHDQPIGAAPKLSAHQKGQLHRAFSIFVFNAKGELLLQKRAASKYHSAGLWTNTCCSHPAPGESTMQAAHRRLQEEMGFDCELCELFSFTYKIKLDHGLTEHEFDHVLIGTYDGQPVLNPEEAEDIKWIEPRALSIELRLHPEQYTFWLRECYDTLLTKQVLS